MTDSRQTLESIAIIGISGRFPGANNVNEFWENIKKGVESIKFFSDQELVSAGENQSLLRNPNYVKARPLLDEVELFDAPFFGINPREAEIMDPQHRVFLECAWAALEDAGYTTDDNPARIGVFASTSRSSYLLHNLMTNPEVVKSVGFLQMLLANDRDYLPTRVSYKMNLTGPRININTACSSSLVAVYLACQSLLNFQSDLTLTGGVTIMVPQRRGYLYQEGGIISPDGHCRSFDAGAKGTIFGSGVGVLVMKRLDEAIKDRDHIYAIIKSAAVNNDGAVKMGFSAPSVDGQAEVIAEAIALAGINADTIRYVETHGTGTSLGDPIEIAALTKAFRVHTDKKGYCAVGSVKTNVGHLNSAAGIAGLIKAVLALKNRLVPPSLHFRQPNPEIAFDDSPFYVNTSPLEWQKDAEPRRASISSFGVGGTNAHVIIEEAPPVSTSKTRSLPQLLVLSARSKTALEKYRSNLAQHLRTCSGVPLPDVAFTLRFGRKSFNYRWMGICKNRHHAVHLLGGIEDKGTFQYASSSGEPSVIFMFPGQGSQYLNMGKDLYQHMPGFKSAIDKCFNLLLNESDIDLHAVLFAEKKNTHDTATEIQQTLHAQLSLFVTEYALAKALIQIGIRPGAMIGHSIGEYVAACLAGVFTLPDALSLLVSRGKLMESVPSGAMLVVCQPEKEALNLLTADLSLAAANGPALCVVSGPFSAIEKYEKKLSDLNIVHQRLQTSHAFHSRMMEPILSGYTEQVNGLVLQPPRIPFISNVTGKWIKDVEAVDAHYWARHLRSTVRFTDGIRLLLNEGKLVIVEVGPGQALTTMARQHADKKANHVYLNTLPHASDKRSDSEVLLTSVGRIWCAGCNIKWNYLYRNSDCRRVSLPTYPFEKNRFWIDPKPEPFGGDSLQARHGKRGKMGGWFYRPIWQESKLKPAPPHNRPRSRKENWLVFISQHKLLQPILNRLKDSGLDITIVRIGDHFTRISDSTYSLKPAVLEHYTSLLKALEETDRVPQVICHLWGITAPHDQETSSFLLDRIKRETFDSLLNVARVFKRTSGGSPLRLEVVTNNMQKVLDNDKICPEKAIILGPCRVIPKEYPSISCRSIDINLTKSETEDLESINYQLVQELLDPGDEPIVAFRGKERWAQALESVVLKKDSDDAIQFRRGGVYLITGGMGGVGLEVAKHLAADFQAKLVLMQRSLFPAPEEWQKWLENQDIHDPARRKIEKLNKLQQSGGEVLVVGADVTNVAEIRKVVNQAELHFGRIDGVLHCAGVPDGALIQRREPDLTESVMSPKVKGTLALNEVFKNRKLDFLILFASLSSYLSPVGQVGYAAANSFLDAFAHYKEQSGDLLTISVSWDSWKGVGMAANRSKRYTHSAIDTNSPSIEQPYAALDTMPVIDSDEKRKESILSVARNWFLDEHRIAGEAILPGTV